MRRRLQLLSGQLKQKYISRLKDILLNDLGGGWIRWSLYSQLEVEPVVTFTLQSILGSWPIECRSVQMWKIKHFMDSGASSSELVTLKLTNVTVVMTLSLISAGLLSVVFPREVRGHQQITPPPPILQLAGTQYQSTSGSIP